MLNFIKINIKFFFFHCFSFNSFFQNLTAPMPTENSGSRFTAKFVNRLAKLTDEMVNNTNAWGTACDEGSGAGSGDGAQGDDIFA